MSMPIGAGTSSAVAFQRSEPHASAAQISTPTSRMAPTGLTLPGAPRPSGDASEVRAARADSVRAALTQPLKGNVAPSRADVAQRRVDIAGEKLKEAKQTGVDIAKTSFFKKMLGVATSAIALGVAIGLTAVSFGGAAPLLGLACATFAVASGDAVCAFRNMRNTQAQANGQPPPYERLPMGNSIVANLAHGVLTRCGVDAETARGVSSGVSIAIGAGLAIASGVVSLGASAMPAAYEITARVASGVNTAVALFATASAAMNKGQDQEDMRQASTDVARNVGQALTDPGVSSASRVNAERIMESLSSDTDSPQALLGLSEEHSGRTRDAVAGATGATQIALKLSGGAAMMAGMLRG